MEPIARTLRTAPLANRREQRSDPVQFFFRDRTTIPVPPGGRPLGVYLFQSRRISNHLPASFQFLSPGPGVRQTLCVTWFFLTPRGNNTLPFSFCETGRNWI